VNRNPGVNEMLALLDALKGAFEDFAAREEKLNHDFQTRSTAEHNAFESGNLARQSKLADELASAEAAFAEEKRQRNARFEKRKVRINQAHTVLSRRVLDEVGGEEGNLRQKTRKNLAEAERRRDVELANAAAAFKGLQQQLDGSIEVFAGLEKSARRSFRGYGKFRRLLSHRKQWPEPDLYLDENRLFEELQRLESKIHDDLDQFQKIPLPRIFKFLPVSLVVVLLLGAIAAAPVLQYFGRNTVSWLETGPVALVLAAVLFFI
jgi:hypothetical protein